MKSWFRAIALVAVLAPVAGCSIYFGDDGDDCDGAIEDGAFPQSGVRNPETGVCEYYGGGCGCGGCDDDILPYGAEGDRAEPIALPNWAQCPGACEGLDEGTCLATAGCRGAYTGGWCPPWADCADPDQQFLECWGTAPGGSTGDCWSLDAQGCSERDDCAAIYNGTDGELSFAGCQPEAEAQGCYSDAECPTGYECTADTMCGPPPGGDCDPTVPDCGPIPVPPACYGICVPSQNSCEAVDCGPGYHCEEQCYPGGFEQDGGVPADYCEPVCVPDWNSCTAIDCGPGYECQELCYPCDPTDGTGCSPICQPECVPVITCDTALCPDGHHCELQCYPPDPFDPTNPPKTDECYQVCVPDNQTSCELVSCAPGYHCEETCVVPVCVPGMICPPPVCDTECVPNQTTVTCESITTEDACLAQPDCVPVYIGQCECTPWICTCTLLEFDRCETGAGTDPTTPDAAPRLGNRGRLEQARNAAAASYPVAR